MAVVNQVRVYPTFYTINLTDVYDRLLVHQSVLVIQPIINDVSYQILFSTTTFIVVANYSDWKTL